MGSLQDIHGKYEQFAKSTARQKSMHIPYHMAKHGDQCGVKEIL